MSHRLRLLCDVKTSLCLHQFSSDNICIPAVFNTNLIASETVVLLLQVVQRCPHLSIDKSSAVTMQLRSRWRMNGWLRRQ